MTREAGSTAPQADPDSLGQELRNVGRHSFVYMLAPAFSKIIGFLLFPLYTRFLTTSMYGVYSLIDLLISFAMIGLSMNIADAMTRFYYGAKDDSERRPIVSTVFIGTAICSLPIALLGIAFAPILVSALRISPAHLGLVRLAVLAAWFSVLVDLGFAYLRLRYRAKMFLGITIFQVLLLILLNVTLVAKFQMGIAGIIVATTIVQAVIGLSFLALVVFANGCKFKPGLFGQFLRYSLPLVPSTAAQQLNNYVHPVMLQWLITDPLLAAAQVGIFSVGQKIGVVVNRFVVVPFNGYWSPRKMELVLSDEKDADFLVSRICTYATVLACAFGLVLSLSVDSLFQLLSDFGWISDPAYLDAARIVPLIALAYVVHSLEHHFATGMHVAKRTRFATGIAIASLTVVLITNVILIPEWGFIAAGFSVLLGVSLRSILFLIVSHRARPISFEFRRLTVAIAVAVLTYTLGLLINANSPILTFSVRLVFGLLYLPILWLANFFYVDENQRISNALSRTAKWIGKSETSARRSGS